MGRIERSYKNSALFLALIAFLFISFSLYNDNLTKNNIIENNTLTIHNLNSEIESLSSEIETLESNISFLENRSKELNILLGKSEAEILELTPRITNFFVAGAIQFGIGKIVPMEVKISKGTGIISMNIRDVDVQSGTTASARTASNVASNYTGISIKNKDITISFINNNGNIITFDGPSGGGAMTVGIIAALEGKEIKNDIAMTGTIEYDGKIGKVGNVEEKVIAAKDDGFSAFLVPKNQEINISGINVIGIDNINDAIKHLIE